MAGTNGKDHVRAHTPPETNERLDEEIEQRVQYYAPQGAAALTGRLEELEEEWDVERYLEISASTLAFTSVLLGFTRNRKWLILAGIVLPFLFQHSVQGWCPPLSLFRRLGVRTRQEIDRERYALKALRGDFAGADTGKDPLQRASRALRGVRV